MFRTLGQERVVAQWQGARRRGEVAHAYLLVGPPRVGKGTLARELAQSLNCPEQDPPCSSCSSCQRIAAGVHPDVLLVTIVPDPKTGRPRTEIGIDQVRDMERLAFLPPFEGKYKVYIIDGAEKLSLEAANAFLKTLEEPISGVVFLLLTSQPARLPPTLVSRCQVLEVRPLGREAAERALAPSRGPQQARLLAGVSAGCLGLALDQEFHRARAEALEGWLRLAREGLVERFDFVQGLASRWERDRPGVMEVLLQWRGWFRDLLLLQAGCPQGVVNLDYGQELARQGERWDLDTIVRGLRHLAETCLALERNANARLALEVLMLRLPREKAYA